MRLLAPAVSRARAHATRFPRSYRALIAGQAAFAAGAGIYVPYGAIYLTRELGASGTQAGAVIAAAGIVGLVGSPLGGVLADRIGRRPVILVSLAGNAALFFLVGSLSSLLAVGLIVPLWGIIGDLLGPAVSAAIADLVEEDELRIEAYALQRVVSNLAFALGLFLVKERGYAAATWGLVFGINPVVVTLCQYPIARWAARRSARGVLAAGALLQGVAMLMLLPFSPLPWLIAAVLVMVVGEMLIAPVSSALAATLAPAHLRGSYQGILNFAWAGAFGPAVFSGLALVGAGHGELMLAWALPLSAVAALCFLPLPRRAVPAAEDPGLAPA